MGPFPRGKKGGRFFLRGRVRLHVGYLPSTHPRVFCTFLSYSRIKRPRSWRTQRSTSTISRKNSSLRIQPPFIRSPYYMRNVKKDVCDSQPEIPYWWRKSVLNPDRSADWFTEQFCIISPTISQCCDVQKSTTSGENLSSPSLKIFDSAWQSVCPMFNVSSLKESQLQAPYSFICG